MSAGPLSVPGECSTPAPSLPCPSPAHKYPHLSTGWTYSCCIWVSLSSWFFFLFFLFSFGLVIESRAFVLSSFPSLKIFHLRTEFFSLNCPGWTQIFYPPFIPSQGVVITRVPHWAMFQYLSHRQPCSAPGAQHVFTIVREVGTCKTNLVSIRLLCTRLACT